MERNHIKIGVLPATVILLGGLNVALGAAVSLDESRHATPAKSPQSLELPGVVWEAPCHPIDCPGTVELDTDEPTYACCDRIGLCSVCRADCPWWNPFC